MSEEKAATPAEQNGGTPPAAPAATPAKTPETVTLTKEQHDQLARDAARAASLQSKADRYDRIVGKGANKSHFGAPATPPTPEEKAAQASEEDRKAERGLMALAADPDLREVLDADPTLRKLLLNNPLGALPILAPDALDADDAISLVKESLISRKKPVTPPAPAPAAPAAPASPADKVPPAGGINTQGVEADEDYQQARKNPNTEGAIAGMIRVKANKLGKK